MKLHGLSKITINKWMLKVGVFVVTKSCMTNLDKITKGLISNIVNQSLDALSNNLEKKLSSSMISLYHYLADNFEDEFMSTTGGTGLAFSNQMSSVENINMISDVGLNTSQLRILRWILRIILKQFFWTRIWNERVMWRNDFTRIWWI